MYIIHRIQKYIWQPCVDVSDKTTCKYLNILVSLDLLSVTRKKTLAIVPRA